MSRKSIICTILALAMILVGTGYAYWTDTLNVTTKATTGDLDVTFIDLGLYAQYPSDLDYNNYWSIIDGITTKGFDGYIPSTYFERGYEFNKIAKDGTIDAYYDYAAGYNSVDFNAELVNATPIPADIDCYHTYDTNGSDNIILTVNMMYPGYAQAFRTDIANIGTMAAKLSGMNFEVTKLGNEELGNVKDMLGIAVLVEREFYPQSPFGPEDEYPIFGLCEELAKISTYADPDNFFTIGGVDFIRLSAIENLEVVMQGYNDLLALPEKNRMDLYIGIAMDPDAAGVYTTGTAKNINDQNDDADTQFKGVQVSIDLLWDQFNEGVDPDTTNILELQNR